MRDRQYEGGRDASTQGEFAAQEELLQYAEGVHGGLDYWRSSRLHCYYSSVSFLRYVKSYRQL